MRVSVIISTYNQPEWLRKVLWGFENQSYRNFEIILADDGSDERTKDVVEQAQAESWLEIHHVWHNDLGYRKCQILNKAILASHCEYLIFTDGDCVPRYDFIEQHVRFAKKGYYLSGGTVRLPLELSHRICREDILTCRAFSALWLVSNGLPNRVLKNLKFINNPVLAYCLNRLTPRKATWNGGNSSGWKSDLLAVNGFDERMEYGGQDVECGVRLRNLGIKGRQLVYSLVCIHLEHARSYKSQSSIRNNKLMRKYARIYKTTHTRYGIQKVCPTF
jgi:glycosyltransferase involved in cell wall biosynthesis